MMEPIAPAIQLEDVSFTYAHREKPALNHINLEIQPGERLCILGANGSGKSTLSQIICSTLKPDAGQVKFFGQIAIHADGTEDPEVLQQARRNVALVLQDPDDQIIGATCAEDCAFGPENLGLEPEEIGRRVAACLHKVGLESLAKADPYYLSGGQKQRQAIAGALAMKAPIFVSDEPTSMLDVRGRKAFMRLLDQLKEEQVTTIHITHFADEALFADKVAILNQGSLVFLGTPAQLFSDPARLHRLHLELPFSLALDYALLHTSAEDCLKQRERAARAQAAKQSRKHPSVISCQQASFAYPLSKGGILDNLDLDIKQGSCVSFIGQTGSGKSTLLRLLSALEAPTSGKVIIAGKDTSDKRQARSLRGRIGYLMQKAEHQLFAATVFDDVAFGPENQGLDGREIETRVDSALRLLHIEHLQQRSPLELSDGQKRLVALAGILSMHPDVLILDEPSIGLDPQAHQDLLRLIQVLCDHGVTVCMATHNMEDAAKVSDAIYCLDKGKVVLSGTSQQVFHPSHKDLLESLGLGLPEPVTWAAEARRSGLDYVGYPLTLEQLVCALKLPEVQDASLQVPGEVLQAAGGTFQTWDPSLQEKGAVHED